MTRDEIIRLIQKAESLDTELPELELKTAKDNVPRDIWKSISAFSHRRGGGVIVFGVSEKPVKVEGCDKIHEMQTNLIEVFNDKMSYSLRPEYHIIDWSDNKTILAVYIPECPADYRPCYFKQVGLPHGAYMRDGITNRHLTDNEFRNLVALSKQFQFDLSEAIHARLDDLSKEKILRFLQKRDAETGRTPTTNVTDDLLVSLGLAGSFGGELKPTVAGYLIFSKHDPIAGLPYERYAIRCVRYAGDSASTPIVSSKDVTGTLDEQIDGVYSFMVGNIKRGAYIDGTKRIIRFEYPEEALRELIANAIIHRDYKITETFTQVCVFENRIEISNPGSLPPGVTVDNIKDAQYSRNAAIAGRLKEMDYLEEFGRGIDIVCDLMMTWGLPAPIFKNSVNSFKALLLGAKYHELNERQVKIIDNLMLKGEISVRDCMKILRGVPRVTINNDLRGLKRLGAIRQFGASVSTSYRLEI
jgi:ATP-dependent DNA helicase RecG